MYVCDHPYELHKVDDWFNTLWSSSEKQLQKLALTIASIKRSENVTEPHIINYAEHLWEVLGVAL